MLYPAFIEIDQDGSASGWFPDVAGCIFAGDTLEEAYADAQSAINAHFELMKEQNLEFPNHGEPALAGSQTTDKPHLTECLIT
ncbi:phage-like protein [Xenorhabdus vietnamensis]|uniref:Phage-like protein n=1 Tax=Xenorhabdus vietnamensis TaxID=351656 RepID=A0A1Y2SI80_9GAMM|nr:phage-like protein [Xenorhabdus vietnamensis]